MRDSIVLPDGRLHNLVPLPEWVVNPPGLHPIKKEFLGQIPSKRYIGKPRSLSDEEQRLKVQREHRPLSVANRASLLGKREEKQGAVDSSTRPPEEECIVRDSILLPDGRLPPRPDNLVPLPELVVYPPGLRSSYTAAAGVTARPAPMCRDVGAGTCDREENSQCSFGAQRSAGKGSRPDNLMPPPKWAVSPPGLPRSTRVSPE